MAALLPRIATLSAILLLPALALADSYRIFTDPPAMLIGQNTSGKQVEIPLQDVFGLQHRPESTAYVIKADGAQKGEYHLSHVRVRAGGVYFALKDRHNTLKALSDALPYWHSGPFTQVDFRKQTPQEKAKKGQGSYDNLQQSAGYPVVYQAPSAPSTDSATDNDDETKDYLRDISAEAKAKTLDAIVGRNKEIERMVRVLMRRKKAAPLLVGEPGVGKTAVVEGLAQYLLKHPKVLEGYAVMELKVGGMVAGTKYRGDFEKRVQAILDKTKTQKVILFVDEVHTMMGAGESSGGGPDLANLLKPALASGQLKLIGGTTLAEVKAIKKDKALERRFQEVLIEEPSAKDAVKMVRSQAKKIATDKGVTISEAMIKNAVTLSAHLPGNLPDKAITLLDDAAGARSFALLLGKLKGTSLRKSDLLSVVREQTRKEIATGPAQGLLGLETKIKTEVIGQDSAVVTAVGALKRQRAKQVAGKSRKPASLLLLGPTGVGKTELVRALARHTNGSDEEGKGYVRVDMGELGDKGSANALKGATAGYVGFDQGSIFERIAKAVKANPSAIILLDEFEKGQAVHELFLSALENGVLKNSQGEVIADIRNATVIATSNALRDPSANVAAALDGAGLTPELVNRFEDKVIFSALEDKHLREIAKLQLKRVAKEYGLAIGASERTVEAIFRAAKAEGAGVKEKPGIGFTPQKDEQAGKLRQQLVNGRSLERAAKSVLEGALAELIVSQGALKGHLQLDVQKDGTLEVQQQHGKRSAAFKIKRDANGYRVTRLATRGAPGRR